MTQPSVPFSVQRYVRVRFMGIASVRADEITGRTPDGKGLYKEVLEGFSPAPPGLLEKLQLAKSGVIRCSELVDYALSLEHCTECELEMADGENIVWEHNYKDYLEHCQYEKKEAEKQVNFLEGEIATLKRFEDPEIMGDAYRALELAKFSNQNVVDFIEAARNAAQNYSNYRQAQKKAKDILTEIAAVSFKLAVLIRDLQGIGIRLPKELRKPLEEVGEVSALNSEQESLQIQQFITRSFSKEKDKEEPCVNLRALLFKVSEVASKSPVGPMPPDVEAALSTRQDSKRSAYLRAFGEKLILDGIQLTGPVVRAMTITANAVMDDSDLSISTDDVRKALKGRARRSKNGPEPVQSGTRKTRRRSSS
jgi:hypothetical protein